MLVLLSIKGLEEDNKHSGDMIVYGFWIEITIQINLWSEQNNVMSLIDSKWSVFMWQHWQCYAQWYANSMQHFAWIQCN